MDFSITQAKNFLSSISPALRDKMEQPIPTENKVELKQSDSELKTMIMSDVEKELPLSPNI